MWDTLLFAVIPYVAVVVAVVGGIARYRRDRFSYSSQSSQFLESRHSSGARPRGTTASSSCSARMSSR